MTRTHYSHHGHAKRPISLLQRINLTLFIPLALIIITALVIGIHFIPALALVPIPWGMLVGGVAATFLRLLAAYTLSLIIAVPLAIWTQTNRKVEQIMLPIFDVLESVPVLVFFPVVIIFFVKLQMLNTAAIFIIFVSMLWTIVFNVISGFKLVPQDIFSVAHVFKISGLRKLREIILPAIFPSIIVGSLLAWAGGWNIIIVAEVLHTYVPTGTTPVKDLFGIGSILVNASANNDRLVFLAAVIVIIITITLLNVIVWQRLLRTSEKFKFE